MGTIHSFPKRIVRQFPREGQPGDPESHASYTVPLSYRGVLFAGAVCFLLAVITGIWKIALTRGFLLPAIPEFWPPHGHLMVGGFLAGVIMFERMIALRIKSLIWVPYAYMFSAILLHTGFTAIRVIHFAALGGWVLHRWFAYRAFHKMDKPLVESAAYITLSSALNYPGGLTAGPVVALAALAFPAVTILVERLEMSLNFHKTAAKIALWMLIAWCALWNAAIWWNHLSLTVLGAATLLVAIAAITQDRSLRISNAAGALHRFLQRSLFVAYAWLILSAVLMMLSAHLPGAVVKDVLFHSMGLGFIFTMLLAHAPLILPAALGKLPAQSAPVLPFLLFQFMTVLRITSDLNVARAPVLWMWTGWITGAIHTLSFLVYVALLARSLKKAA